MNKEEHFLSKRIMELAENAYTRNVYTFTDFLNINEQNVFNNLIPQLPPVRYTLSGGNPYAERKLISFAPLASGVYFVTSSFVTSTPDACTPVCLLRPSIFEA